jgi:hypothetical protein
MSISLRFCLTACAVVTLGVLAAVGGRPAASTPGTPAADNRYVGANVCKNCHNTADKGDQHGQWMATAHAKAFDVLASDKAKEVAKAKGIADPQKSESCVPCHVTAHSVDKKLIKKGFKLEAGVQCESCHGPGENHFKARMAAAAEATDATKLQKVPAGEIIGAPEEKGCLECHNEKSPTYKPFCFKCRNAAILHLDPRKERSKEEVEKLKAGCGGACKGKAGEASGEKKEAGK